MRLGTELESSGELRGCVSARPSEEATFSLDPASLTPVKLADRLWQLAADGPSGEQRRREGNAGQHSGTEGNGERQEGTDGNTERQKGTEGNTEGDERPGEGKAEIPEEDQKTGKIEVTAEMEAVEADGGEDKENQELNERCQS